MSQRDEDNRLISYGLVRIHLGIPGLAFRWPARADYGTDVAWPRSWSLTAPGALGSAQGAQPAHR